MKFNRGDLVILVSINGDILTDHPPGLILSGGIGYPINPCVGHQEEPQEIYTILYNGVKEWKVSADWLNLIERAN